MRDDYDYREHGGSSSGGGIEFELAIIFVVLITIIIWTW